MNYIFIFPFNYFFTWTGGRPLNRKKNENKVDSIAAVFLKNEVFIFVFCFIVFICIVYFVVFISVDSDFESWQD